MRILALIGSKRKGNSVLAVKYISNNLGVEIETVNVAKMKIEPCKACYSCLFGEECKIEDDVQQILEKIMQSDFILISSPVYWLDLTGKMKMLLDRFFMIESNLGKMKGKRGAVVYFYGFEELRGWASNTYNIMLRSIGIEPIAIIPIHAALPGEVFKDENRAKLDMLIEAIKKDERLVLDGQCPMCLSEVFRISDTIYCPICGSKFDSNFNLIEKGGKMRYDWLVKHYEKLKEMKEEYMRHKDELKALIKKYGV